MVARCDHLAPLRFSKALPQAFTEHGAIMAASVLNSPRAVEMSIFIVRAFVAMRRTIAVNSQIAQQVAQLERRLGDHDEQILLLVRAIKQLAAPPPEPRRRRIGFNVWGSTTGDPSAAGRAPSSPRRPRPRRSASAPRR